MSVFTAGPYGKLSVMLNTLSSFNIEIIIIIIIIIILIIIIITASSSLMSHRSMVFLHCFYDFDLLLELIPDNAPLSSILCSKFIPIIREAPWPSGRESDSGARGRGSILTQVAVLCP